MNDEGIPELRLSPDKLLCRVDPKLINIASIQEPNASCFDQLFSISKQDERRFADRGVGFDGFI
jgi:hypothetical protein